MSTQLRRIRLGRETPPSEFLLWTIGPVDTVKGVFQFTEASAELVVARFAEIGNRLPILYKHASEVYEARPNAASALIEMRGSELWVTDIRWTDPAADAVANREWLYVSPEFMADKTTGEIVSLDGIALTNTPATKHAPQLVAASREGITMDEEQMAAPPVNEAPAPHEEPDGDEAMVVKKAIERHRAAMEELAASHAACRAMGLPGYDGSPYDAPGKMKMAEGDVPEGPPPINKKGMEAQQMSKTTTALAAHAGAKSAEVQALSREIEELKRRDRVRDAQATVDEAVRAGHVTPAERSELVALGTDNAPALERMLKIFASRSAGSTPVVTPHGAGGALAQTTGVRGAGSHPVVLSRNGATHTVMLSAAAIKAGVAMGMTVEQLAASQLDMDLRFKGALKDSEAAE